MMKKRHIKYLISYIGTALTVWTIFNKEAVSLVDPAPGQIEVIAAFNIGAALLFVLAGLMDQKDDGYTIVLIFAVGSRIWTFYHISILFSNWIMWEMVALNIVVIGFEFSTYYIARGQTEDYQNDVKIYKNAYDAIMHELKAQFPEYPQLKGEPVDSYVKRLKQELDVDMQKNIDSAVKANKNPLNGKAKKKPGIIQASSSKSEQELRQIYQNWIDIQGKHPSSRELGTIWKCSNATAINWRDKLGLKE